MSSDCSVSGWRPPRRRRVVGRETSTRLLDEHPLLVLGLEDGLPGGEGLVDGAAGLADALAGVLAGLRRQRADLAVGEGERASGRRRGRGGPA